MYEAVLTNLVQRRDLGVAARQGCERRRRGTCAWRVKRPVYTWNTGRRLFANCLAGNAGQDMVAFSEPCPRVPLHRSDVGQTPGGVDKSRQ